MSPADEGAEKEPVQKVELKGDDKTEIQFSGKTSFRFMLDGKWGDGTVGALTIRKDKASGKSWLQVNNESKVRSINPSSPHPNTKPPFRCTVVKVNHRTPC